MASPEDRVRCPCDHGLPRFCPIHHPLGQEKVERLIEERKRELEHYRRELLKAREVKGE